MKIEKDKLSLEKGLQREWIVTNGIGGYAASTIIGANTRRYHGLLIAAINPPAQRKLILSKLDESIQIGEKKYDLYTNIGKTYTSQGYKYLESFSKDIIPVFTYNVNGVIVTKTICMVYGKNTVVVFYKIKNGKKKAKFTLAPIINYRDFHNMSTNHEFNLKQQIEGNIVKIVLDDNVSSPIYISATDGKYIEHNNDIFRNMFYIEEEKRGFFAEENHAVSGRYEIDIESNEEKEFGIVCSTEEDINEIDLKKVIHNEIARQNEIFTNSLMIDNKNQDKSKKELERDEIKRTFLTAIDNFIVYRPKFGLHTVIAGYPWFLDWGRDTLIAFEGIFLKTKRYEDGREALLTIIKDIKYGLVPNGYSETDNSPLYNSVDSSLLLFEQVQKYLAYTNDFDFVKKNIFPSLKTIIDNYKNGITFSNNNIYLDEDGLIYSGNKETQNTWMDAKYEDFIVTPRYGKVVEINALWYNALMIMIDLSKKFTRLGRKSEIKKYEDLAKRCKQSFEVEFYNGKKKCLFDCVDNSKIRPNQLFALSLSYPVIDPNSQTAYEIIETTEKKLLNNYGLKTLAKGEKDYVDIYEGDSFKRDVSYHQGITWPWLLGLYYDSLINMEKNETDIVKKERLNEKLNKFKEKTEKTFKKELYDRGCIGQISELHDSKTPFAPKGAFAQAWSVAEIFRILY